MNRRGKQTVLVLFDLLTIIFSSLLAYAFLNIYVDLSNQEIWFAIAMTAGIYFILGSRFRVYSKINRYTSIRETVLHMLVISLAYFMSSLFIIPFSFSIHFRFMLLSYIFSVGILPGSRILWRIIFEQDKKRKELDEQALSQPKVRTLLVGAGAGGSLFVRKFEGEHLGIELLGIVDDDPTKQGMDVYGVPVIGQISELKQLVKKYHIEQVTITIPSLQKKELERIIELSQQANVKVNKMPSIEKIMAGNYKMNEFQEIDVVDLLGRDEVDLNMKQIGQQLTGKTILVTGAGGSIGSEIVRQLIRFSPKSILLLGHGEHSIYLIEQELKELKIDSKVFPIIADIQDRERIFQVMEEYQPDMVYHAAAHKHVPLMEKNPREAVKNNIYGTKNVAEAAKAKGVKSFVMISTDKAVNPPNIMGATKRITEMLVTGLNAKGQTKFTAVRFGNILASRGSVIPLFEKQIKKGGPITVTDFRMTRYFMTIPEASRLVLQAGALAKGGEIFVLDMGAAIKILDLAKKMIRLSGHKEDEIEIVETGIRPGEKLHEELLTDAEMTHQKVHEKIFVGKVENEPKEAVLNFLESLEELPEREMKEKLLAFANQE